MGETRNEVKLPNDVNEGTPTEAYEKVTKELVGALEDGTKDVIIIILKF